MPESMLRPNGDRRNNPPVVGTNLEQRESGIYVVFEGPQGAGKTTISDKIRQDLYLEHQRDVRKLHEPNFGEILALQGGVDSASSKMQQTIISLLKDPRHLSDYALAKFYNSFRIDSGGGQYINSGGLPMVREALEQGMSIVADRNWLSTIVNQVALGEMTVGEAREIYEEFAIISMIVPPDIVFIIEREWELVEESLAKDGYDNAYRQRGRYYFQKAAEVYRKVGEALGVTFIQNNTNIEDVAMAVKKVMNSVIAGVDVELTVADREIIKLGDMSRFNTGNLPPVEAIKPKFMEEGQITVAGEELLSKVVTKSRHGVYLIRSHVPISFAGAVMARLSRTHLGLRELLLLEFLEETIRASKAAATTQEQSKSQSLQERVVVGFGDDSVAQLSSIPFMVEGASALAIKEIEWHRLGAYLEQSTRYIPFNIPGPDGKYRYHIPEVLDQDELADLRLEYTQYMDKLFVDYGTVFDNTFAMLVAKEREDGGLITTTRDQYWENNQKGTEEEINQKLNTLINGPIRARALDAARAMLPIATKSNVGVVVAAQQFEYMITRMLASSNTEVRMIARSMLEAAQEEYPVVVKRVLLEDRGVIQTNHFRQVSAATEAAVESITSATIEEQYRLDFTNTEDQDRVESSLRERGFYVELRADTNKDNSGREESNGLGDNSDFFDPIIEYILCTIGDGMSSEAAQKMVADMSVDDKKHILGSAMGDHHSNRRNKVPRSFEAINFLLDMVVDYGIFRDLQRHRMLTVDWPRVTPYLGYSSAHRDTVAAGMQDVYEQSFHNARDMYDKIVEAAQGLGSKEDRDSLIVSAQEALLLGTYMRSHWKINFRSLIHMLELRTQPAGHEGYRKVCQEMFRQLCSQAPWMGNPDDLDEYGIPKGGVLQLIVNMSMDPETIGRAAEYYRNRQIT